MAVIKYGRNGQLGEASSSNMGFVGKVIYPETDPGRRGVVLNSLEEILGREKQERKLALAEQLSERMQEKRRLEAEAISDREKASYRSDVLKNDQMTKTMNRLKNNIFEEAVMQGADFDSSEYKEYSNKLPLDSNSDWEGWNAGVPWNLPVDTGKGENMRGFGSWLSDVTGISVDASKTAEQKAREELARAVLPPQPGVAPIIAMPAGGFAHLFQQYKYPIMIGGALLAALVVYKVVKK